MSDIGRDLTAAGLANAFSSALLNPSDVTKIRLQSPGGEKLYGTLGGCVRRIVAEEGAAALWTTGLTASMIREAFYSSTRMGLYPHVKRTLGVRDDSLAGKITAGAVTGSIGSVISNPIDVVKVRIMAEAGSLGADGRYASGLRAGHLPTWPGGTLSGLRDVIGGGTGLRGASPSVLRGALMAATQLSSYDHSKRILKRNFGFDEGTSLHVTCSIISSVCCAFVTGPADMIKTRVMGSPGQWGGPINCLVQSVRNEGVMCLWRGVFPSYLRLGPHFIITFPLYERLRYAFGLGYM
jgi:dicarboxylate transporter 10